MPSFSRVILINSKKTKELISRYNRLKREKEERERKRKIRGEQTVGRYSLSPLCTYIFIATVVILKANGASFK